ncbi:MAG TPA: hypothetical protein VNN72_16250 [Polyangiaceae bacterium]|nr:hypothetical protein [Polyangiaceae bacterium]
MSSPSTRATSTNTRADAASTPAAVPFGIAHGAPMKGLSASGAATDGVDAGD